MAMAAAYPAPKVTIHAGPDRITVLPGKTFLQPAIKSSDYDTAMSITWSKLSGPGDVTFEDANSANTAASFSAPGDYVLQLAVTAGSETPTDLLRVQVEPASVMSPLLAVDTAPYKINSSFWKDRYRNLIINWIPHCITEISDPKLKEGGIENFVQAANKLAGRPYTKHVGYPFANAWVYNTIEAMCYAQMFDPQGDQETMAAQQAMQMKLNEWIPIILSAQEPDGYLQTNETLSGKPRWSDKWDHEGYVGGYFLEAAIAHYRMTNGQDRRLYNAAKRLANCWYDNIGPVPKRFWYDGHEEMEQALVRFARLVDQVEGAHAGDKYVQLAKFLLDCRGGGDSYDQTQSSVIQQYEAVGHAVRAVYLYTGMADVAAETGDVNYQSAIQSIWSNLVNKKYYLTGGVGSGETAEGFGADYSLPNHSYCESCAACGELFFQHAMNLAYHNAKYADLYEQTLYNGILGDLSLDGKTFTYTNELDSNHERYLWHQCPCCVGNIPRTLLQMPTWMYSRSANGIYVNLFVGSAATIPDVSGTTVQMVQQTDYPLSGNVTMIVNPAKAETFAVNIRVPQREVSALYTAQPDCDGITSISVNGQSITPEIKDGYVVITRQWNPGDRIDLVLPMKVQTVKADDRVIADQGRVALQYGPLIYNIEHVDQNLDRQLDEKSPLTVQWDANLLDGINVIHGKFTDGSPMLAIPNYARNNRGGRSIVWMRGN